MVEASGKTPLERIYCNRCRGKTQHELLKTVTDQDSSVEEDIGRIYWSTTFEMLQCCGCREAVLRRTFEFSELSEPEVRYYPPPASRQPPPWQYRLPNDLMILLAEIYHSLDANTQSLPLMGARALIDILLVQKVGDLGTFKEKLKRLQDDGFVSSKNREILEAVLDVGSAAVHRGHKGKADEINAVMDIVENMLHAIYVLPGMAHELRKSTPPRLGIKSKP